VANQTPSLVAPITQTVNVHSVQSMNPKGNKQSEGKRKSKNKNSKGDNKARNNDGEGKTKRGR
jgi:hypothetical protein